MIINGSKDEGEGERMKKKGKKYRILRELASNKYVYR